MKKLFTLILAITLSGAAFAQTEVIKRAADAVSRIHDRMNDPDSFVLVKVFTTKPDKHGDVSVCYAFRARNAMGGYGSGGRAVLRANNSLEIFDHAGESGEYIGWDAGWVHPCGTKQRADDITAEVKAEISAK
ncbi:MAG: hypothetical protein ABSG23_11785 [Terriglobales bacterium]|jgi:hypothetical protein